MITSQNTEFNHLLGDKDYTSLCDYKKCDFVCQNEPNNKDTTHLEDVDKSLIEYDIQMMKRKIKQLFKKLQVISLSYEDIYNELNIRDYKMELVLKYTLNSLVTQESTEDKFKLNGVNGYLVYISKFYIFQPDTIKDKKVLHNERLQQKKIKPNHVSLKDIIEISKVLVSDTKDGTVNRMKKSKISKIKKDDFLNKQFNELKSQIVKLKNSDDVDDVVIWGMVLDNLNKKDYGKMIRYLCNTSTRMNENFIEAAKDSNAMFFEKSDDGIERLYKFFNLYTMTYKCVSYENDVENGEISSCKYFENQKFLKDHTTNIENYISSHETIHGYSEVIPKDKDVKCKLIDPSKAKNIVKSNRLLGSVCIEIPKKETIIKYIEETCKMYKIVDIPYSNLQKQTKKHICNYYEYILRASTDVFYRPIYVQYWKKQFK
jgi:hypothetical protein